jgi:hypothetical protein
VPTEALSQIREKATITSVMSVRPHGTTRLSLDGFSLNLILGFFSEKSVQNVQGSLKYTYFSIFHSVPLRMKNVSEKSCRENQNTIYCLLHTNECTVIYYVILKFYIKTFKSSYMFRSLDHPQGAYIVRC